MKLRSGEWHARVEAIAAAAILALGSLAACGRTRAPAPPPPPPPSPSPSPSPPPSPSPSPSPRPRPAVRLPGPGRIPETAAARGAHRHTRPAPPTTWFINPDAPLPPTSPWRPVLAAARRFATADLSYEVDEIGPAVRRSIASTCTAAFAAQLLSQRPTLPPGVHPGAVRQRLVAVTPLERVPGAAVALVTVRAAGRGGAPGAFELSLVPRPGRRGGWRVAAMTVV